MFFFYKQKTAYEMRMSDWSSDVCYSDLHRIGGAVAALGKRGAAAVLEIVETGRAHRRIRDAAKVDPDMAVLMPEQRREPEEMLAVLIDPILLVRSEEHTSELQSLMRISYAGFCLNNNNNQISHNTLPTIIADRPHKP